MKPLQPLINTCIVKQKQLSEEQLIQKIKKDPQAFARVYDRHYHTIFTYCFKRTNDFNISKDICSETFLKAFLNINKFNWRGISILSWLYKIATNELNLHFRSKKYRPALLSKLEWQQYSESEILRTELEIEKNRAENELLKHEQFIKIQQTLKTLPIKYQEVISLRYYENLKIKELSQILNKPEGTIKSLLSRGLKHLRNLV